MRLLVAIALCATLVACGGCESTKPAPTKLPPLPAKVEAPKPVIQVTVTPVSKFNVGDRVTIVDPSGKVVVSGVVLDVGPIVTWTNPVTKKEIVARAYRIKAVVDGVPMVGVAPEFALTLVAREEEPPVKK
jgi:hypothetical protein